MQGIQGIQGDRGLQGDQGQQGDQGLQGVQGAIGLQGVQGPQGEIGLTGSQGDQGAIGATGVTGPQGEIGVQGPQGEIGLTGPQGDQGVQGEIGLTGLTGPAGSNASITMGAISASSNSNGASITSGVLILTPADATNGGIVTNDTQTIAGAKTFNNSVAVGAVSSTPSAVVEITSTTQGFLLPRMTAAQRIAISSPVSGLSVYQTDDISGFYYFDGSVWKQSLGIVSSGTNGQVLTADGAGNATWTTASLSSSSGNIHTIGESYGGGIVFYVYDDGQHGLIAATSNQSSGIRWYNNVLASNNGLLINASRDGIGAGKWNTERIIANQGAGNYAAQLCANYQGGGYGDWYLPSKYELNLLYLVRDVVGGISETITMDMGFDLFTYTNYHPYWSSTEYNNSGAWWNSMNDYANGFDKDNQLYVRAIRSF
jgi:hypothetical protein